MRIAPMISSREAKEYLSARDIMPKQETSMVRFGAKRARALAHVQQALHPDMTFVDAIHWVNQHAMHFELTSNSSLKEALGRDYYASDAIQSVSFNTDFLPLLGTASKLSHKLEAMEDTPHRSLRSLARSGGVDPDYAVALMEARLPKLHAALRKSVFMNFEGEFAQADKKRLEERYMPDIERLQHDPAMKGDYVDLVLHMFMEKAFAKPVQSDDKTDYLVTPAMQAMFDLPRVKRLHGHSGYDFGSITTEEMLGVPSKGGRASSSLRFVEPCDFPTTVYFYTPEHEQRFTATPPQPTTAWREPPTFIERLAIQPSGKIER